MGTTQNQKKLFYRLRSEQQKLAQLDLPAHQSVKLLAAQFQVSEKEIEEMQSRLSQPAVSLDAPREDSDALSPLQRLADPRSPVDRELGDAEQREVFHDLLQKFGDTLEGREKTIFTDRLRSEEPLTLQELGDRFGITKERTRQLEDLVLTKLKAFAREHYPDFGFLVEGK